MDGTLPKCADAFGHAPYISYQRQSIQTASVAPQAIQKVSADMLETCVKQTCVTHAREVSAHNLVNMSAVNVFSVMGEQCDSGFAVKSEWTLAVGDTADD